MFRTATSVCTGREERRESIELAGKIAVSNGYTPMRPIIKRAVIRNKSGMEKVAFCVPFISDEFSAAIRRCLMKANLEESVAIVQLPLSNLGQMLIPNRNNNEGDCMSSCVVYMISCVQCGDECILETARPLCIRIKEHLDGKKKSYDSTPLGCHRVRRHSGEDIEVKITILAREPNIAAGGFLDSLQGPKDESQRRIL